MQVRVIKRGNDMPLGAIYDVHESLGERYFLDSAGDVRSVDLTIEVGYIEVVDEKREALVPEEQAVVDEGTTLFATAVEARAAFETAEHVWKQARDAYNHFDHTRLSAAVSALHEAGK